MSQPFDQASAGWMRRAISLAMRGRGAVEPNPMVGCVIVKDDRVIGEGFHGGFGLTHAEPAALASCTEDPRNATAFVTLEPCCHTNKKTPPCVPRLSASGLAKVVIGCLDPNPDVNGKGVAMLRQGGLQVQVPFLEAEARQLIAPFIARTLHHRPYITLKWAQSADGKVAGPGGRRQQIANSASMRVVHGLRSRCDAIAVGINTVLNDDPLLLARGVDRPRPLIRYVLDRRLRIPVEAQLVQTAEKSPVVICSEERAIARMPAKVEQLREAGVRVHNAEGFAGVLADMHGHDVTHLLIEPGPTLARALLDGGLVDRVWIFRSPQFVNDDTAPRAVEVDYPPVASLKIDGDTLTEYLNPASPVFFAPEACADLMVSGSSP